MALVSKSIPNLINGISQQPPSLRLGTQGEAQENGLSDIVDGLKKRPHTNFIKKLVRCKSNWTASTSSALTQGNLTASNTQDLTTSELNAAFISTYKRSDDEQYTVVILPDATTPIILVYDILGNLRYESAKSSWLSDGSNISYVKDSATYYANSDSTTYLIGLNAAGAAAALGSTDITSTSVADATFIVNKTKTVELTTTAIPAIENPKALVYLKSVNYGREYTLKIKSKETTATPITASYKTESQNSNGNNDTQLKVSNVISDGGATVGGVTQSSLRSDIIAATTASNTGQDFSAVNKTSDGGTTATEAWIASDFLSDRTFTPNSNNISSTPSDMTVLVGGSIVPYHTNNDITTGWSYQAGGFTSIVIPLSVCTVERHGKFGKRFIRASVTIYKDATSNSVFVLPTTYSQEPYFVISSEIDGGVKDFDIIASDDDGGVNLRVFKDNAKSFTDLPNQCIDGFRIQVAGDNNKKEDNFYVQFQGGAGSGVWKETVAAGLFNDYNLTTMPHQLRQDPEQVGSLHFCFEQAPWDSRVAGDDSTNPAPSFVGSTINDIFFHRNRLGVLSGENVIFSEASGYYNFYRTTVRALLDSDPIDVAVSQNEVSILKAAVPIQDNLLLFSELNQFTLSAAQLLTPAEVTIDQSTKFECDLTASPVGAGNSVFFGTKGGSFAGVREFYTDINTEIKDATLITQHVPHYLEGNIRRMVASTNEDMLICLTSSVKSEAYIYKYYDQSNERLQSSWSKWTFDTDIVDISFNNSDLYITFADGRFEKMALSQQAPDISFVVTNDVKADLTSTPAINTTYSANGFTYIIKGFVSQEAGVSYTGFSPDISSGFGSIDNASITQLFLYKETDTSVTPNTSVYKLHGTIDRRKLDILKLEDYPTSITLEGTTITLDAFYTQRQLDLLLGNILLAIDATITETQFNALFNNSSTPTEITLNRVSTTFTKKNHPVHLDHQVKLQASTSAAASFTTSDLNAAYTATSVTQFIDHKGDVIATGNSDAAKAKVVAVIHNKEHTENGATVGSYVYAGEPFTFKYQLSEQVFKPAQGDATDIARFQLRNINFKYNDTGTFDVTTVSTGRTPKVTNFTGRITGQANNLLGYSAVVDDGSFKVGVQSQAKETAITITNSSHLPSTFQSAEWEGFIHTRNRRI